MEYERGVEQNDISCRYSVAAPYFYIKPILIYRYQYRYRLNSAEAEAEALLGLAEFGNIIIDDKGGG